MTLNEINPESFYSGMTEPEHESTPLFDLDILEEIEKLNLP
jgi:hypothetical protein